LTHRESTSTTEARGGTETPPEGRPSQINHRSPVSPPPQLSSPPQDTQPFSQFVYPAQSFSDDVVDEEAEGVWGYLLPRDQKHGETLVLRTRYACPAPAPHADFGKGSDARGRGLKNKTNYAKQEEQYEVNKRNFGFPAGGYLVGRHPECGMYIT
jgi:serine/threonine-protein kinase Chk2